MSYLGLDVGTTGSKACVFDAEGNLFSTAYREYPPMTPLPGGAEIDSGLVCQSCLDTIREAAAACPNDPVCGVGISAQGEAFTPVSADGRILANAMVSSDARAEPIVAPWSQQFGPRRLYEITGHTSHPMFTLFKLLWLRDQRPDVWQAAAKFYCFEELIQWRLGLEPAISWPLAGRTMLFDVRRHEWDAEILSEVDLDVARLAPAVPSGTVVGTIPSSMTDELGLPEGVPVVAGGHDQPCGALGAGVVEPGVAMYATGTVECICPAFERPIFEESFFKSNLCTYDYTSFDAKTPGAILGLRLGTTRSQVLRALLEGIALEMRLNVDILEDAGLNVREFRAIGGGAKNPTLTQLKADVLGRPITTLAVTEAGCLGVAMLACAANTGIPLSQLVETWVKPQSVVEPNPKRAAFYEERFQAYKELYPAIRDYCEKRVPDTFSRSLTFSR